MKIKVKTFDKIYIKVKKSNRKTICGIIIHIFFNKLSCATNNDLHYTVSFVFVERKNLIIQKKYLYFLCVIYCHIYNMYSFS